MKTGELDIYRLGVKIATVLIDETTEFNGQINSINKITAKFRSRTFVDIQLLDYIIYDGLRYQLNEFVDLTINEFFNYSVNFESPQYDMLRYVFQDVNTGEFNFSVYGDAETQLSKVVELINTKDSGWSVGDVEATDAKTIEYMGYNARGALNIICNEFGLEFVVDGKEISLKKIVKNSAGALVLEYGKQKGLTEINRRLSGEFFTRVIVEGGSRNIPSGYRGGRERLVFDTTENWIDKGVNEYGIFEKALVFDDIYPERTGYITSVAGNFKLSDSTIDFNLKDNFITGEVPYIVMVSGDYAGEQFEIVITSYDYDTQSFSIKPNYDGGLEFPNSIIPISVGDMYKFVGINLPQSYIDDAEQRLYDAGFSYIQENGSIIEMAFSLNLDEKFVRDNELENELRLGRAINILNTPAGINADLRIVNITFPILVPSRIRATISDKIPLSQVSEIQKITFSNSRDVVIAKNKESKNKRYSDLRLMEVQSMIFDPSGEYFDPIRIKPESIDTLNLNVGSRTQSFVLNVTQMPNYSSNANAFGWTAGNLVHYTVIPGSTYTWNITAGTQTGLNSATAYYVYARCNKANDNATLVVDTAQRQVDSDSTYFYFLVGVLGVRQPNGDSFFRWYNPNYGTTSINGAFIQTGEIRSSDGLTSINLDNGIISGRFRFLNSDSSGWETLSGWAFNDTVADAMEQETIIIGGYINTDMIDVDTLRAEIITVDSIEGLELNFTQGTIGGIEIKSNGIESNNGNFSVDADGLLKAIDVELAGEFISGDINGTHAIMDASGITFTDSSGTITISTGLGGAGVYVGGYSFSEDGVSFSGTSSSVGFNNSVLYAINSSGDSMNISATGFDFTVSGTPYSGKTVSYVLSSNTLSFVNGILVN